MQHRVDAPSAWVARWAHLIRPGGSVLDLACGHGRHARFLAGRGLRVTALDRDAEALGSLRDVSGVEIVKADVEAGPWPFADDSFDALVVVNYLHRLLFPHLLSALRPDGVLIYETFMQGNERYGRPSNPDFLLCPNELLDTLGAASQVVAFEQGFSAVPKPAVVQRLCALKDHAAPAPLG